MHQRSSKGLTLGDNRRLTFYAAVFNSPATVRELHDNKIVSYTEVILPGAFSRTLASNAEVITTIDHDRRRTFAKRSTGELILQTDPHGLFGSVWIPEDDIGTQVYKGVESGEYTGCSFTFAPLETRTNRDIVERVEVDLVEVCITGSPTYLSTEIHLRTQQYLKNLLARYRYSRIKLI